ncbi:dihydroxyacetone kinase-like protein [Clostridium pascui]|uniref:dihydroxyacetone kinase subunit L n=1 Tax=Clostridium pascui TaxID=46609 RepID=UPI001956BD66|nr:dihydroxyacetone kinase subunit L [Clostridium pascui]MBM7871212.1 dihydroxyacetone kinase-like protein [Clostridium pascui]
MDKLNGNDIKSIFKSIRDVVDLNKAYLIELDGIMGDGDLGITMSFGFNKITEALDNLNIEDIGMFIMKAGMIMADEAPSTLGTLVATGMIKGGKALKGKKEIDLEDIIEANKSALNGMMERGKSKRGNKTILDSLFPALDALIESKNRGKNLQEAFNEAYKASREGVENTKIMKSVHGRAAFYGDKSIGNIDAGAVLGSYLYEGSNNYIQNL